MFYTLRVCIHTFIFISRSLYDQYVLMFMNTVKHRSVITLHVCLVIYYQCYRELCYMHAMIIIIYNQKMKLHGVYRHW